MSPTLSLLGAVWAANGAPGVDFLGSLPPTLMYHQVRSEGKAAGAGWEQFILVLVF